MDERRGALARPLDRDGLPQRHRADRLTQRRRRHDIHVSVVGALAGVVASPVVYALLDGLKQPHTTLWTAAMGSMVGATVFGHRCRP